MPTTYKLTDLFWTKGFGNQPFCMVGCLTLPENVENTYQSTERSVKLERQLAASTLYECQLATSLLCERQLAASNRQLVFSVPRLAKVPTGYRADTQPFFPSPTPARVPTGYRAGRRCTPSKLPALPGA